jgi:hypothetical protein
MANPICKVNVNVLVAPTPSTLQKTGALISQGGTSLAANSKALLTQLSDLTPLLALAIPLASLTQSAGLATATLEGTASDISSGTYNTTTGLVTLTLSAGIGLNPGDPVLVASATGTGSFAAINGTWPCAAGTSGATITFFVAAGLTMTITGGTCEATIGLATNATFLTTIAGAAQAGYNGTFLATVTGAQTFTFAVPSGTVSPATGTPTFTPATTAELLQMATTFFAQGTGQGVYVLELGTGTPAQGVTALSAYITANPGIFYSYLVPRSWDAVASFLTFLAGFNGTTAQTYFFITTTLANYASYAATMKCALLLIEAPGVQATEFSMAAVFWVTLNYSPSSTNRVTPLNLAFLVGVTPYPPAGNAALLSTLNAANVSVVGTGAAGGISAAILLGGNNLDGNPFNYWYSVDWVQINVALAITAALISGSNNPSNPLYYNQAGINALLQVAISTMGAGIAAGLVLNPIKALALNAAQFQAALAAQTYAGFTIINADPFAAYVTENPNDYKAGIYKGFSIFYVPLRGFTAIVFNVTVSSFPLST